MSDIIEGDEELLDDSVSSADDATEEIGQTSDEAGLTSDESSDEEKSLLSNFTIFDAMLLVSLLCVGLATLLLLLELRNFGNFPTSFPWRTNEF